MIDSHAHLSSPLLRAEIDSILHRATEIGLSAIINISTDPDELAHALLLKKSYPWLAVAGATTPHDVEREGESAFPFFEKAALAKELVAIGETGLDYYYEHSDRALQKEFLRRYIALAQKTNLPLIIHCRDAFEDLFALFDESFGKRWGGGVLHCFTGTMAEAERLVAQGWMISFSGIVTFKKSMALREVAAQIPLDNLLIETDAPYLAPQSKRGLQNEPSYLPETARCLAELRGLDFATFVAASTANAKKLFKWELS